MDGPMTRGDLMEVAYIDAEDQRMDDTVHIGLVGKLGHVLFEMEDGTLYRVSGWSNAVPGQLILVLGEVAP